MRKDMAAMDSSCQSLLLTALGVTADFSEHFLQGQYTCKEGKNSPCLVYVSFNQKIYIYWKVELERMESSNLQRVLEEKPEFKSQLEALGVDSEDPAAVRDLVANVLYQDAQT